MTVMTASSADIFSDSREWRLAGKKRVSDPAYGADKRSRPASDGYGRDNLAINPANLHRGKPAFGLFPAVGLDMEYVSAALITVTAGIGLDLTHDGGFL